MNRPASGSCDQLGGGQPGDALLRHGVPAVQVLVDVLHEVGDPQLREYVVVRVVVDGAGPLGRLQPADQVGAALRRRRRARRVGHPAEDDGQRRLLRAADRERGHHPVAVPAVAARGRSRRPCPSPASRPRGSPAARPTGPGTGRPVPSRCSAPPGRPGSGRAPRRPAGSATRRAARSPAAPRRRPAPAPAGVPATVSGRGRRARRSAYGGVRSRVRRLARFWSDHLTS